MYLLTILTVKISNQKGKEKSDWLVDSENCSVKNRESEQMEPRLNFQKPTEGLELVIVNFYSD